MNPTIHDVVQAGNLCGEGPIWDVRRQCLWWVDLIGKRLFRFQPDGAATQSFPLVHQVSALALAASGTLLLAGPDGMHVWDEEERESERPLAFDAETLSFNDMVADSRGRIYAGTLHLSVDGTEVERAGQLLLMDARTGSCRAVDEGFEISNGIGLSPGGDTLYHADSGLRRVYAYTVDCATGALSNRTVFAEIPDEDGVPDGLTVDSVGNVWCALWFSGKVVQYAPDGRLLRTLVLPVSQVSSLAFGGRSLCDLYITTASERWNSRLAPEAFRGSRRPCGGSLYRASLDLPGKAEHYVGMAPVQPPAGRAIASRA